MGKWLSLVSFSFICVLAVCSPRASAQSFFLTPVPNAPFSAVVKIERTEIGKDGLVIKYNSTKYNSTREIARDSQGRIHNELRSFIPVSSTDTPKLLNIHLYDPQTRISTEIDVLKRTFWTITISHPPSTEPPSIRFAAPDGDAPPSEFTKQEDLGIREIAGVPAHGMRQTQTLPGENGGKEVVITDEHWYSQDLRIYVMIKHSDPRKESSTLTVDEVSRAEPDAAFFKVPEGYAQPAHDGRR